jgi:hypothetical protein
MANAVWIPTHHHERRPRMLVYTAADAESGRRLDKLAALIAEED